MAKSFIDWMLGRKVEDWSEPPLPCPLTPAIYLERRVDQNIKWYDGKAVRMKDRYLWMRGFSVIAGGLVPVIVNIPTTVSFHGVSLTNAFVTVISLMVVIVVSLESVFHYREQWKNYRSTEQLLRHEKFLFSSRVGVYQTSTDEEAFKLLVQRVEEAIAIENSATLNVMTMAAEMADAKRANTPVAKPVSP